MQQLSGAPAYDSRVSKHALTVVPPTPPGPAEQVRQRLRKTAPAAILQCPRCAGREVIQTKTGVMLKYGKPSGGTRQMICALCLMRGERVVLA
jgi:hypothetical protein